MFRNLHNVQHLWSFLWFCCLGVWSGYSNGLTCPPAGFMKLHPGLLQGLGGIHSVLSSALFLLVHWDPVRHRITTPHFFLSVCPAIFCLTYLFINKIRSGKRKACFMLNVLDIEMYAGEWHVTVRTPENTGIKGPYWQIWQCCFWP